MSDKREIRPLHGAGILIGVILVMAAYLGLLGWLGNIQPWPGFLFILYYGMAGEMKVSALPGAALGAFVGTGIAAVHYLPPELLDPQIGLGIFLALILISIFATIVGWAKTLVNMSTFLFLTVLTIPGVVVPGTMPSIALGLAVGVAFFGGVGLLLSLLPKRGELQTA